MLNNENVKLQKLKVLEKYTYVFFNVKTLYDWRGRKPQAQTSQIFHYFLKIVKMRYYVTIKKEKEETMKIREKEEVGRGFHSSV